MNLRLTIAEADLSTLNVSAFCRDHGLSRDRFYAIRRRYDSEGAAGLESRSRAPHRVSNRTPASIEDLGVSKRKERDDLGLDAGPASIRSYLSDVDDVPSEATIWRILTRRGFITADPAKAPKRALRRFTAERANESWQLDDTSWELTDCSEVKILNIIDDHSRLLVASVATRSCTGTFSFDVVAHAAMTLGWPQRFQSDNAKAFRDVLAALVAVLGVAAAHSRPFHPQTNGKVERFHQSLKKFLAAQGPATTIVELQAQLDMFRHLYNHHRPHRSINRQTPAAVWATAPKAGPADQPITAPPQVTINTVSCGTVHGPNKTRIAVAAAHNGKQATTILTGLHAHVFINGALIRQLTIDPTKKRQNLYNRPGRPTT